MIRRFARWLYRRTTGYGIQPMPKGDLFQRLMVLNCWIKADHGSALR